MKERNVSTMYSKLPMTAGHKPLLANGKAFVSIAATGSKNA